MYMELLKRFEQGKTLKMLDPIEDMEIEFDPDTDTIDIKELVDAKGRVEEELTKSKFKNISQS